ncbi:hypothetical protein RGQ21_72980 [Kitasatospora aureofaciens]|nr:hypothetical protein RGQ21_72980 [Kitasatospora aureofaciens]
MGDGGDGQVVGEHARVPFGSAHRRHGLRKALAHTAHSHATHSPRTAPPDRNSPARHSREPRRSPRSSQAR